MMIQPLQTGIPGGPELIVILIVFLVFLALPIAGTWKVFTKAGKPGWGALVPIYNAYLFVKIAGRPGWWVLLMILPLINVVVSLVVAIDMASRFGKGTVFGIALWILPYFLLPVLGFGAATYRGPGRGTGSGDLNVARTTGQ
jgi:hypothetical protein